MRQQGKEPALTRGELVAVTRMWPDWTYDDLRAELAAYGPRRRGRNGRGDMAAEDELTRAIERLYDAATTGVSDGTIAVYDDAYRQLAALVDERNALRAEVAHLKAALAAGGAVNWPVGRRAEGMIYVECPNHAECGGELLYRVEAERDGGRYRQYAAPVDLTCGCRLTDEQLAAALARADELAADWYAEDGDDA